MNRSHWFSLGHGCNFFVGGEATERFFGILQFAAYRHFKNTATGGD